MSHPQQEPASDIGDALGALCDHAPDASHQGERVHVTLVATPLGPLVVGATSAGICLAEFTSQERLQRQFATLRRSFGHPIVQGATPHSEQAREELGGYFRGTLQDFSVPLVYAGSPFQRLVWELLRQIPYGATRSYKSLAVELGRPEASRAVGTANGQNPISILIPCHRLLNSNGQLAGYGGGLWRKRALLDLERSSHHATSSS